jgi:hypothetical protein
LLLRIAYAQVSDDVAAIAGRAILVVVTRHLLACGINADKLAEPEDDALVSLVRASTCVRLGLGVTSVISVISVAHGDVTFGRPGIHGMSGIQFNIGPVGFPSIRVAPHVFVEGIPSGVERTSIGRRVFVDLRIFRARRRRHRNQQDDQ